MPFLVVGDGESGGSMKLNMLSTGLITCAASRAGSEEREEAEAEDEGGRGFTGRGEPLERGVPSPSFWRRRDELVGRVEELVHGQRRRV